jgi:ribosomal protein L18E
VKVLGQGDLTIALNVTANKFSASALKKIEAAGGSVTLIEKKKWKRDYPIKAKKKAEKTSVTETTAPESPAPETTEPTDTESNE